MKKISFIIVFLVSVNISAEVIAYPVPFNPLRESLTITENTGKYSSSSISINLIITDINGDKVYTRSSNTFPVLWKGYNSQGGRVAPGLYVAVVKIENRDTGENETKILRLLIKK